MSDTDNPESPEDQLPPKVVAELRDRSRVAISIPGQVDDQILADARRVLRGQKTRRARFAWNKWTMGTVAVGSLAAALLVAVLPQFAGRNDDALVAERQALESALVPAVTDEFRREDFDRDGHVNILDAFALARQVQAGSKTTGTIDADFNADGIVDKQDVDFIAMTAVAL